MRILIVDDDKINCLGIKKWIEEMEFSFSIRTETAYCAEDALAYAKLHRINILITDIQMGNMNGLDLIEHIREYSPNVISLVITAYARFPYAHRAISLGVKSYLLKPFGKEELKAALTEAIAQVKPVDLKTNMENPVEWAKLYVKEHIESDINMAVIANELNLSYTYFSKIFRQETGKSFLTYVKEMKMYTAGEMLQAGKSIAEVSERLGYGTQQNFSRAFNSYWGCSPNSYRREKEIRQEKTK